ncbi:MAG: MarR family transcriptional regulator, partial [Candidatus Staskawiczbacteria bacterium]|nr:MarR family transcriptional regulator [Candidatus Staskawiczbacteria bacterium]
KLLSIIFNVGRLIKEEIHASNCLADFTYTEVEILKFLNGKKNTAMKSIADYLHIKPSSATPLIDNLMTKGVIKRIQTQNDRRIVYIELTPKGAKALQKKYKNIHNTISKVFGDLNEKDKKNLIKIFEKIHAKNV